MNSLPSLLTAAIGLLTTTEAFTSIHVASLHPSALHAKPRPKRGRHYDTPNKGFGKRTPSPAPAPTLNIDKSYGPTLHPTLSTQADDETAMHHFFSSYIEWHPLFREVMISSSSSTDTLPAAHIHLPPQEHDISTNLWSSSTGTTTSLYPWKVLPDKPQADQHISTLSLFLDEWQTSLQNIPMDAFKDVEGGYDLHFLEEGRRTIAVTRFHVVDYYHGADNRNNSGSSNNNDEEQGTLFDWESQLFQICWSELGHLMNQDEIDTGSLILLPPNDATGSIISLEQVQEFVLEKLIRPMEWLGRANDWEIVAMERGIVGVRLLYKLGEIPDLSEKYQMED